MPPDQQARLRALPSVHQFLASPQGEALCSEFGNGLCKLALGQLLNGVRQCLQNGRLARVPDADALARDLRVRLLRLCRPAGRRAINATGILLHTGLGRAPLCQEALDQLAGFDRYSVLQTDLDTGKRSRREEKVEALLQELTGCEAALVVNNNAAATMLVLNTLAAGKEVVVSRGQLIEIGGAYRMMDVMAMSGCRLREVGCTNRTHLSDYAAAVGEETGALIHVHTSNYRIRGFAGAPDIKALAGLGRQHGLPVIDDLGSGALVPLTPWGLPDEPLVPDSIKAGASVACFSGDKLIGGPQAGILVGRRQVVERLRKNPFARMFRVGKMTLAVLEATLPHFLNDTFREAIPFYRMLERAITDLRAQGERVTAALGDIPGLEAGLEEGAAYVGSGSIPDEGVPSVVVRLTCSGAPAADLARRLRQHVPAIFGRVQEDALLLDMRTLAADEVDPVLDALREATARD